VGRLRPLRVLWNLALLGCGGLAAILLFHLVIMPLFVRHGHETEVPDLRGLPAPKVPPLLDGADLRLGRLNRAVDDQVPPGRILRQYPAGGMRVKKGREVNLVVSQGPAAREVPNLEGESLVHARFRLAREGIPAGKVRYVASWGVRANHLVAVSPPPGIPLRRRSAVDLLVSKGTGGQRFIMPDLRGRTAVSVKAALEYAGLRVREGFWPGTRGRRGLILDQTPPPGYPVTEGETIEIQIGER
jgi:serine/threonine-protein kinase